MNPREIHAVIGVWHRGPETFYVRRSMKMENYPGVWSLLSIQFDPSEFDDVYDFDAARNLFRAMSAQRLNNAEFAVKRYLSSANCVNNPMRKRVFLHMYELEMDCEPELNQDFYTNWAWMTPKQYARSSEGMSCGLCVRMWSEHCVRSGLADSPFALSADS
jgi:hypothetical protein